MKLSAFDYELPESLIAQQPAKPRDASRLLVLDRARGSWEHRRFSDIVEYLGARDVLVANDTRVIKARLLGQRRMPDGKLGGKVEFLMLEELEPRVWEGLLHASAKYNPGLRFHIPTPDGRGLEGELVRGSSESDIGAVVARFDRDPVESGAGEVPLPKYIRRAQLAEHLHAHAHDIEDYQTVYARVPGSAAAPTAGLHFTPELLARLRGRGVGWENVTLNVGVGTFRPVKVDDVSLHVMHEERFEVGAAAARAITEAKREGKRVIAVGTTSVRTLESAWDPAEHELRAGPGRTRLYIRPGAYEFGIVGAMVTNFHLPKSTLLMLVSAFAGRELVLDAYREAVREKYRFFSYGDAMLII